MQKLSFVLLCILGCALSFSSCKKYDDEWIKIKSDDFEKRIAALETWQTTANAEIISLQNLIKSINENDFVTKVTPLEDGTGYVISFKKGGDITIKHGEKGAQGDKGDKGEKGEQGEKGDMPVIGTKQDTDGIYYWTMGGEWILDGDKKMPVTGEKGADAIAPRIRIDEDTLEWEISTDGGVTYTPTGIVAKGDKGDSMFSALDNTNEKYVELTLADGETKIQLPRYAEFAISFDIPENETFYATPANNELALVLPATLKEEGYRSIIAAVTPINGGIVAVKSFNDWKIEITTPEFDENGNVVEGSAKLAVTGNSDSRLSDTYMLRVALVSAEGNEVTATRLIKYFDGVIADSTEEITDNNVARLAWKGEITTDDFKYIRENLASTLQLLDLSVAEMTELPKDALSDITTLKEVVLPEGLTAIGNEAFARCSSLEKVNIPATVTRLGVGAFRWCVSLENIIIPEGVTELPDYCFFQTTSLKSVTVPGSVEAIKQFCFELSGVVNVNIKEGITTIGNRAFFECGNLEKITIPQSVTSFGENVFSGCKYLKEITIPEGVTEIKPYTFYGCESLKYISWHDNITSIGNGAFYNCKSLSGTYSRDILEMPENLRTLGRDAFRVCESLKGIDMSNTSVKEIPRDAFSDCERLTIAKLPATLETISESAFHSTNIDGIEFPATLKEIKNYAFYNAPLTHVESDALVAPTLGGNIFSQDIKDKCNLYIPASARSSYDTQWTSYFRNVIEI